MNIFRYKKDYQERTRTKNMKNWIKPLNETNLGVTWTLFDP